MFSYTGYLTAQESTRALAHSALPGAPTVRSDDPAPARHARPARSTTETLRRRAAVALYQLADRVQPA
jgi:hypothetical protein